MGGMRANRNKYKRDSMKNLRQTNNEKREHFATSRDRDIEQEGRDRCEKKNSQRTRGKKEREGRTQRETKKELVQLRKSRKMHYNVRWLSLDFVETSNVISIMIIFEQFSTPPKVPMLESAFEFPTKCTSSLFIQ